MEFITRMFTASDSDNQSGAQYNAAYNAAHMPMPEAPKGSDASDLAQKKVRARRLAQKSSESVFASPLGLSGQADVTKKTLLGQ
jgi:hypothetical protein